MEVKVGDPNTTINGRHRYLLDYELPRDVLLDAADTLAWDAVGTKWTVPIQRAEVHIVAPWELEDATCHVGTTGATGGCELREVEPGHLVTEVEDLDPGEGVTVRAERGAALAATPNVPPPPVTAPPDPGVGLLLPAVAAATAGLGSALDHLDRSSAAPGASASAPAAWPTRPSPAARPPSEVRLDEAELAEMATTDFAPPTELTPAQGGLLHAETVRPAHKVAWLIQAAIDGEIDLVEEEGKQVRLVRKGQLSGPLATAFGGRDEIELGSYDSTFARGWGRSTPAPGLEPHERPVGPARRPPQDRASGSSARWRWWPAPSLAFFGGFAASRWGEGWLVVVVVGALLGGGGFAALLRGWELRVRTPYGSGLWLRVESFRRFLHESETFHAEEAAKRGVLRGVHGVGGRPRRDRPLGAGRGRLHHDPAGRRARLRPHGADARQLHRVGVHRARRRAAAAAEGAARSAAAAEAAAGAAGERRARPAPPKRAGQRGELVVGDLGEQHRRHRHRVAGRERRELGAESRRRRASAESAAPSASSTVADDVGMIGAASTASTRTTLMTVRKITAAASASAFTTFHGSLCSQ